MGNLKKTFDKQGGMQLIHRYAKSGSLWTAVNEFLLLGKSRTALEILRLAAELKTKQYLEKKYKNYLDQEISNYIDDLEHKEGNNVWFCWFQGIENAPLIVKKCYESAKKAYSGKMNVKIIDQSNYKHLIHFPNYIQNKIDAGIINGAHLSDLIRLELLINYGGIWSDATVFYSSDNIPTYMLSSDLFMFQCLKPGRDGHSTVISNWFISSKTNNKILILTRNLLYEYWKNNNEVIDYYVFHDFFQIVIESCPEEWDKVIPFSSSTPHILLLRLFDEYNDDTWQAIKAQTTIHKLSYKYDAGLETKKNTYFRKIILNE